MSLRLSFAKIFVFQAKTRSCVIVEKPEFEADSVALPRTVCLTVGGSFVTPGT